MRQINNTEQFIKAKQAIAQQERGKGITDFIIAKLNKPI